MRPLLTQNMHMNNAILNYDLGAGADGCCQPAPAAMPCSMGRHSEGSAAPAAADACDRCRRHMLQLLSLSLDSSVVHTRCVRGRAICKPLLTELLPTQRATALAQSISRNSICRPPRSVGLRVRTRSPCSCKSAGVPAVRQNKPQAARRCRLASLDAESVVAVPGSILKLRTVLTNIPRAGD